MGEPSPAALESLAATAVGKERPAVGETVIQLQLPSFSSSCFNRDWEGMSAK